MKYFLNYINKKTYYVFLSFVFLILLTPIFYSSIYYGTDLSFLIVSGIVYGVLVITYILIPEYGTKSIVYITLFLTQTYLTVLSFVCRFDAVVFYIFLLSPLIAFIFSDKRFFYFMMSFNLIMVTVFIFFIINIDTGIIKFSFSKTLGLTIISQLSLLLVHYLINKRLEQVQMFFEELKYYERLTATNQITASIVHEIKNPLTIIKGYLQLNLLDEEPQGKHSDKISIMLSEVEQIENEVNFLLNMSKPTNQLDSSKINVEENIQHIIELMKPMVTLSNVDINLEVKNKSFISINSIEFKQVILNIIKNAVEASSPGQVIQVSIDNIQDYVKIEVQDNGCGMSKEDLDQIGTAFFSKKSLGTGLGMLVCNNIINKYNGKIIFNSKMNKGTKVTILFKSI